MRSYHKNPRHISDKQFSNLQEWLRELGDLSGVVHDLNSDEIIGGNMRGRAFDINRCQIEIIEQKDEPDEQGTVGFGFVVWEGHKYNYRQVRWTDQQCEKANIVANRAGGEWDFEILAENFKFDDLLEWGFDEKELRSLDFGGPDPADDPGAQIDRAEELREKWGVETGQLWQIGRHRLICGDCTDRAVVERVMGGEKAQLVVTSPPYAVGKEYEEGVSFSEHLQLLRDMADRCIEIVVPGGFIFTNFGEIAALSHAGPLTGSKRQCIYPISRDYWDIFHVERGCDLYAQRIWYKPFNRLQQPFWSYHTSIPHHQEWEHIWTWRTPGGEGDTVYDWDVSSRAVWNNSSTQGINEKPLTLHVAAFPLYVPENALKAHSPIGAIIYEPFLGSGTTLVACERLGRQGRGVEISPGYVAVALERLAGMGLTPELVEDGQ